MRGVQLLPALFYVAGRLSITTEAASLRSPSTSLSHDQHELPSRSLQSPSLSEVFHASIPLETGFGGCSGEQEAILDIYNVGSEHDINPRPIILHLPGGAYMNLVAGTIENPGTSYVDAGYSLAVLNYRLPRSPTVKPWLVCSDPHEALDDVAAAINHLHGNAEVYGIDSGRIVIAGFSAGGHLAAWYGITCTKRGSCPAAMVLHFPFLTKGSQIACSAVGVPFANMEAWEYEGCSPTASLDAATPPTILYHASGDTIVSTLEMTEFVSSLAEQGVSHEYYEVPQGGHYLVPYPKVAAVSNGALDGVNGTYADLVQRALLLSPPACVRCDDVPTQWMMRMDKTCSTASWHIENKCVDDVFWAKGGYCRSSCYDAGRGYVGETCCPPSMVKQCKECDDVPTQWMENNGRACNEVRNLKCHENRRWVRMGFCRKSCFDAGRGYNGDTCC